MAVCFGPLFRKRYLSFYKELVAIFSHFLEPESHPHEDTDGVLRFNSSTAKNLYLCAFTTYLNLKANDVALLFAELDNYKIYLGTFTNIFVVVSSACMSTPRAAK